MNTKLSSILLAVGLTLSLNSCKIMLNDFVGHGYRTPTTTVQTGTNAA